MKKSLVLFISFALPYLAGFVGSIFTTPALPVWYASLTKPPLNPPAQVFAPVWLTLYALMGISLYRIWRQGWSRPPVAIAVKLFFLHLVLNSLWSLLFFGLRQPLLALLDIIVLWISLLLIIIIFHRQDRPAAYLLLPYLIWISFATYLNAGIWLLN